jgi:hypothetical protein
MNVLPRAAPPKRVDPAPGFALLRGSEEQIGATPAPSGVLGDIAHRVCKADGVCDGAAPDRSDYFFFLVLNLTLKLAFED